MQAEVSFIDLFLGASLVVQLVMIILFVLAGTSWWFIFDKWLTLSRARKDIYEFETDFWNSKNIEKTFNELNRKEDNFGLSQIFVISHEEFLKAENFEKAEEVLRYRLQNVKPCFLRFMCVDIFAVDWIRATVQNT